MRCLTTRHVCFPENFDLNCYLHAECSMVTCKTRNAEWNGLYGPEYGMEYGMNAWTMCRSDL